MLYAVDKNQKRPLNVFVYEVHTGLTST